MHVNYSAHGIGNPNVSQARLGHGLEIELVQIANDRLILGPQRNCISVDHTPTQLDPNPFNLLHLLSINADTTVERDEIIHRVYGWDNPSESVRKSLFLTMTKDVFAIREKLGKELGDPKHGVIRSMYTGYIAVTNL